MNLMPIGRQACHAAQFALCFDDPTPLRPQPAKVAHHGDIQGEILMRNYIFPVRDQLISHPWTMHGHRSHVEMTFARIGERWYTGYRIVCGLAAEGSLPNARRNSWPTIEDAEQHINSMVLVILSGIGQRFGSESPAGLLDAARQLATMIRTGDPTEEVLVSALSCRYFASPRDSA